MEEARLIDANDFLDLFYVASAGQDRAFVATVEMVVKDTPTIEAEPVRHGIWEPDRWRFECSLCHKWFNIDFNYYGEPTAEMNYCPHCGARMDGDKDD